MSVLRLLLRNREGAIGLALLTLLVGVALFAPVLYPDNPLAISGPPLLHPFTDTGTSARHGSPGS